LSSRDPTGWAAADEKISGEEKLWRQYVIFVELYRYYIDLVWKASIWLYTAIGASLIYFFDHLDPKSPGYLPLLLLFLSFLSGGISIILARAIPLLTEMESWLEYIADSFGLPGRPHVEFVRAFYRLSCVALWLIALACTALCVYLYS
jgi:hypothetical protein